jgi:hypothetical protein
MIDKKHHKEFTKFIQAGDYEFTDGGILIHNSAIAGGNYYHTVNGEDEQVDHNLLPAEGILAILECYFGGTTPPTDFYMSLYSGNVSPASTWTAANYVANATENTSQTEGYSGTSRPTWTPGAAAAGKIGNLSARASYTIVASTTVTFYGAGMHTVQTRGATTGTLASATKFAAARTLNDTDTFELGYEIELTDS